MNDNFENDDVAHNSDDSNDKITENGTDSISVVIENSSNIIKKDEHTESSIDEISNSEIGKDMVLNSQFSILSMNESATSNKTNASIDVITLSSKYLLTYSSILHML